MDRRLKQWLTMWTPTKTTIAGGIGASPVQLRTSRPKEAAGSLVPPTRSTALSARPGASRRSTRGKAGTAATFAGAPTWRGWWRQEGQRLAPAQPSPPPWEGGWLQGLQDEVPRPLCQANSPSVLRRNRDSVCIRQSEEWKKNYVNE